METELIRILDDQILDHHGALRADADLFELGLDSMAIMQLLLVIEDEFGVALDPADVSRDNFRTPSAIAALIRSRQ